MLPAAAVFLRTSVRLATSRTFTRVSAPALTTFRCLNRALSTTHALAAASSLNRDRAPFRSHQGRGAILQEHLDEFCGSILLLYELDLYPVIVHGGGPQLNSLLEAEGVVPQSEDGIRVTDAKTLTIARKLFLEENLRLVKRFNAFGIATRAIQGAFEASYLDKEKRHNLQKELFTDSGAVTLIRLGNRIQKNSSIKELQDIKKLEATSNSSSDSLGIAAIVDQFASILTEKKFTAYYDDAMHCMAIVMPQDQGTAILTSLSTTKSGWLNGTMENIFTGIKKDYPTLAWADSERDKNLT
ncbi:arg-6 [Fusarium pseudocircinatum]|uniref:Arg-6 n=1 Tax=Fusarium pseudocircinatum TaxID=56676 RepID=A0A8H5L282_9HYPO|nr:arg-6 [Fusarium pseudocircinatum]